VTKDGANVSTVLITDQGFRDPQTKLFGIQITELGISHDFAKIVFQFHGNLSESEIPIQYAATAEVSPGDFTCLIDTITGPDCVNCEANPDRVMAFGRKTLQSIEEEVSSHAGNENGSIMMALALTIINLMGMSRK